MAATGRTGTPPPPPATTAPLAAAAVRRYQPSDLPRIAAICATVYGGTDTLPHMIKHQLEARPTTATVLVAQQATTVQGVVCAEQAGSAAFLFGLRVAEEARGNGIAKQLMDAVCQQAAQPAHIRQLLTTTIPQNGAAQRILQQLGFRHTATVDRWPPVEAPQFKYEEAIGFTRNTTHPEQPVSHAPGQPNMLDHIPGARQAVTEAAAAAGVQPRDWVLCRSVEQLQTAVASIRQQQQQRQQQQRQGGRQESGGEWLPWVYRVHPVQDCEWTATRVAAGEVFLLPHPAASNSGSCWAGCVVLAHSSDNFRTCSGVLVVDASGSDSAAAAGAVPPPPPPGGFVAAALEFVASRTPHFVAYVDSGRCHSGGGGVDPALRQLLPPVLMADGGAQHEPSQHMCFMVLGKDAVVGGGVGAAGDGGDDECGQDSKL